MWAATTRTHTVPPIVVIADGDLGFSGNNQMSSLFMAVHEDFSEEEAYEPKMRSWGGTFRAKDTLRHGAVDTTGPFSQEERCPFIAVTSRKVYWG